MHLMANRATIEVMTIDSFKRQLNLQRVLAQVMAAFIVFTMAARPCTTGIAATSPSPGTDYAFAPVPGWMPVLSRHSCNKGACSKVTVQQRARERERLVAQPRPAGSDNATVALPQPVFSALSRQWRPVPVAPPPVVTYLSVAERLNLLCRSLT